MRPSPTPAPSKSLRFPLALPPLKPWDPALSPALKGPRHPTCDSHHPGITPIVPHPEVRLSNSISREPRDRGPTPRSPRPCPLWVTGTYLLTPSRFPWPALTSCARSRPQPELGGAAPFTAAPVPAPQAPAGPMAAAAAPQGRQGEELRALGRAVRLLQRLEERCGDPRLTSSPPSLRDLLPRTAQLLREVAHERRATSGGVPEASGGARDFLVVYLTNLENKSKRVAALLPPPGLRSANDELFREGSSLR